jgi:very-short-patch-repair endonuclease
MVVNKQAATDRMAKVHQLFEFVKAYTASRFPIKRRLDEQPLPALQMRTDGLPKESEWMQWWSGSEDEREWLLRVQLCPPNPCPVWAKVLTGWLLPGWEQPNEAARHVSEKTARGADGNTRIDKFEDSPERISALREWLVLRDAWVHEHQRHEPVRRIFSILQSLRAELQKQAERYELVIGVGLFQWERDGQQYQHPLILKPLDLEFDSRGNAFLVVETDRSSELYSEPLAELPIDLSPSPSWREQIKQLHPLDVQTRTLVKSMSDWLRGQPGFSNCTLSFDPVIFLRDRGGWPTRAASAVLADLASRTLADIPIYLQRLAGVAQHQMTELIANDNQTLANEDLDILFALPANIEQLELARQLEQRDAVLVQGPPGTGKTHTIANLLGHLLAQGKRVLVTSNTSKALRVLRSKVPESIQSLCVSVVDVPAKSRQELEQAVRAIAEKMQSGSASLQKLSERKGQERVQLIEQIRSLRSQQRMCITREYEPLIIGGESFEPSMAGRLVNSGLTSHDWIPGPLLATELGKVCPLDGAQIRQLYRSQLDITPDVELELDSGLPLSGWLPSSTDWQSMVAKLASLKLEAEVTADPVWPACKVDVSFIRSALDATDNALATLSQIETVGGWLLLLVEAGFELSPSGSWKDLSLLVKQVATLANEAQPLLHEYAPEIQPEFRTEDCLQNLNAILGHLEAGRSLAIWKMPLAKVSSWKSIIEASRCNDRAPSSKGEFVALVRWLELTFARERLRRRWHRQVQELGGPPLASDKPEVTAQQWMPYIGRALMWAAHSWKLVSDKISPVGCPLNEIEMRISPIPSLTPRLSRARRTLESVIAPELRAIQSQYDYNNLVATIESWRTRLRKEVSHFRSGGAISQLDHALARLDVSLYTEADARLQRLQDLLPTYVQRNQRLHILGSGSKAWADSLRHRLEGHDSPLADEADIDSSWRWRQFNDELVRRHQLDATAIAAKLRESSMALEVVTSELITACAWARQLSASERFRQHLVGWLDVMRRIGKGTGQKADGYRVLAREQLREGQNAVPVWIMPLSQVFESFSASDTRFDVVIIDEASQSGLEGLLAAYLGEKIVVVGDHEQVSPDAVGHDLDLARNLQTQYLQGIPNAGLYDGKLSLYDLTRQSTSGMLSLSEHFRCIPAIIGFSNGLSYEGRIKPLREPLSSPFMGVVPHRVQGQRQGPGKVNRAEAEEIVSLISAMCQHDDYRECDIGVISLLGDDQALLIERLLRQHVPVAEIESRKIICGNAAQFQGDERHVMFLSMVDSNEGDGPMRKQGEGANELIKKRYNVAASRAQDQMWIVHSISHETDLKPGDLRRELLDYAFNDAQVNIQDATEDPANESEFERLVTRALRERGYRVRAQYAVGFYRIDLVVEGNGKRLAVECDGDRWHSGPEKIADDLARQAVLERIGWRFHRIRGSEYFRDPTRAIQRLVARLDELEIPPEPADTDRSASSKRIHEEIIRSAQIIRDSMFLRSAEPQTPVAAAI